LIDAGERQERRELVDAAYSVVVKLQLLLKLNWTMIGSGKAGRRITFRLLFDT
jgi:hypothetical protein